MRILAIDTSSTICSVALFDDGALLSGFCEDIGRGHAERLVPLIAHLPDRGRAREIHVSLGPGSFTGVRIGLAAGRALGLAWQAEVLGYPALGLLAAMAGAHCDGPQAISVATTGGHGEWFVQDFGADGLALTDLASLTPDAAAAHAAQNVVAGDQARALVDRRGHGVALDILPDARELRRLPPSLLTKTLSPLYGRPPDARLPATSFKASDASR